MNDKILRKLWWVPALAIIAACDPFEDENTGTPVVLEVLAAEGDPDGAYTVYQDADLMAPWLIEDIGAGPVVFIVKTNKLLDGASIQASTDSCAPAADLNLNVNGVDNPAGWFACYQPTSGSPNEGSSIVIYQGTDTVPGIAGVGSGYFENAVALAGTYDVTAGPEDKQGATLQIAFTATVIVVVLVDAPDDTVASGGTLLFTAEVIGNPDQSVTWSVVEAGCGSIDAAGLYTAPTVAADTTCTIEATSDYDPAQSGTFEVTVTP